MTIARAIATLGEPTAFRAEDLWEIIVVVASHHPENMAKHDL